MCRLSRFLFGMAVLSCFFVLQGCNEEWPEERRSVLVQEQVPSHETPGDKITDPVEKKGSVYGGANGSVFRDSKVVIFLPETGELLGSTSTNQDGMFLLEALPLGGPYILRLSGGFECSHDGRIIPLQTYLFSIVPEVRGKTPCQITPLTELMYWLARAIQGDHFIEPKSVYYAIEILRHYFGVDVVKVGASQKGSIEDVKASIRIRTVILQLEKSVCEAAEDESLLPAYEQFSRFLAFLAYDMVDGRVDGSLQAGACEALVEDLGLPEEDAMKLSLNGKAQGQALATAFAHNVTNAKREEYLSLLEQAATSFATETNYEWRGDEFRDETLKTLADEKFPVVEKPVDPNEDDQGGDDTGKKDDPGDTGSSGEDENQGGDKPENPEEPAKTVELPATMSAKWNAGELPKISCLETSEMAQARVFECSCFFQKLDGTPFVVPEKEVTWKFVGEQAEFFQFQWKDEPGENGSLLGEVRHSVPEEGFSPEKVVLEFECIKGGVKFTQDLEICIDADPISIRAINIGGDFWERKVPSLSLRDRELERVQGESGEMLQSCSPVLFEVTCWLSRTVSEKSQLVSMELSSQDVEFSRWPDRQFSSTCMLDGVARPGEENVSVPLSLYMRSSASGVKDGVKSVEIHVADQKDPTNQITRTVQFLSEDSSVTGVQCLMSQLKIVLGEEEQEEVKGLDVLECFGTYDIQVPVMVTETIPHSGQVDLEEWTVSLGASSLAEFGSEIELLSQEREPLLGKDSNCLLLKMKYTMGFFRIGEKEGDSVVYTPKADSITVTLSRRTTDDDPVSFSTELVLPFLQKQEEL